MNEPEFLKERDGMRCETVVYSAKDVRPPRWRRILNRFVCSFFNTKTIDDLIEEGKEKDHGQPG